MSLVLHMLEMGKRKSPIHALNPLAKMLWWASIIIIPIIITNPIILLLVTFWTLALSAIARIGKELVRTIKILYPLLIGFIVIIWPLFYPHGEPLLQFSFIKVTTDGIIYALAAGLRIVTAVTACLFFTMTTDIADLASATAQFAQEKLHVSYTLPFLIVSSFKFLPEFIATYATVKESFMSRAVEFEKGGFVERIRKHVPLFIPIILSSLEKAKNMTIALELKGFRAREKRTFYKPSTFKGRDYLFAFSGVLALAICLYIRIMTNFWSVFFWC